MTASTTHRHTPRISGRIGLAVALAALAVSVGVIAAASPHGTASAVPGRPSVDLEALRTEARLYEGTSFGIDVEDLVDTSRLEGLRTEARLYEGTSLGIDVEDLVDPASETLPDRSKAVDRR